MASLFWPVWARAAVYTVTSTADSGPGTFRAALAVAAADGADSVILVTVTGTVLVGSDTGVSLPDPGEPGFALTITGNGLVLDGGALVASTSPTRNGLEISTGGAVAIDGLELRNFPESGLRLYGDVGGGVITNVRSLGNRKSGILVEGTGVAPLVIDGCELAGNDDDGITLVGALGHEVRNTILQQNGTNGVKLTSGTRAVWIHDNPVVSGNLQAGVLITQGSRGNRIGPANRIEYNQWGGVQIDGTTTAYNAVVTNAVIDGNGFVGVSIAQGAHHNLVADNLEIADNIGWGISVANGAWANVVAGNVAVRGHGIGIRVDAARAVTLESNTVYSNDVGIQIAGGSAAVEVEANTVRNNNRTGVVVGTATGVRVGRPGRGNAIHDNGEHGVDVLENAAIVRVLANTIRSNVVYGIGLRGDARNLIVAENLVENNGNAGIHVSERVRWVRLGPGNRVYRNRSGIEILGGLDGAVAVTYATVATNATVGIHVAGFGTAVTVSDALVLDHRTNPSDFLRDPQGAYGIWIENSSRDVQIGSAVDLVGNDAGLLIARSSNVRLQDPGGTVTTNLVGVYVWESDTIEVLDATIVGNSLRGVLVRQSTNVTLRNDDLRNNGGAGVEFWGGAGTLDGLDLRDNTIGLEARFYDAGEANGYPNLAITDDTETVVTLTNARFGNNAAYGARFEEALLANLADVVATGAGNDFGGSDPGLEILWRGFVEGVNAAGIPVGGFGCQWEPPGPSLVGVADVRGWCPGYAEGTGAYERMPKDWTVWPLISQVRIDGSGNVLWYHHGSDPHVVTAQYGGGPTSQVAFSWDGDLGNDPVSAISTICPSYCVNQVGPSYARFQVARVQLRFAEGVFFADAAWEPVEYYREGATTYVQVADFDGNRDANLAETVTAIVVDSASGDVETLVLTETDLSSGVFRGSLPTTTVPTGPDDGTLTARDGDLLEVRYWDVYDPALPSTSDTVLIRNKTDGLLYFIGPGGTANPNQVLGGPVRLELVDGDQNLDPGAVETITGAVIVENDTLVGDLPEPVVLVETGPDTGVFRGSVSSAAGTGGAVDGVVEGRFGDKLRAVYTDPRDADERRTAFGLFVPAPTTAQVRIREPETGTRMLGSLPHDQPLAIEIVDSNRNLSATSRNQILAGDPGDAGDEDGIVAALDVVIESLDPNGARLDWEPLTLEETGDDTGTFRTLLYTSSHIGRNPSLKGNGLLEVVVGGRLRLRYRDALDPGDPPEEVVSEWEVVAPAAAAVTVADPWGHPWPGVIGISEGGRPFTVLAWAPTEVTAPQGYDTIAAQVLRIVDVRNGDDFLSPVTRETAVDSALFSWSFAAEERDQTLPGDSVVQGQPGDLVHVRLAPPSAGTDATRWAHETALLCRNTPAYLEIVDRTGRPLSRLVQGDLVAVRVYDPDQNADRTRIEVVRVELRTTAYQDYEPLNLLETGPDTGLFAAELPLDAVGDAVPGDRRLRVRAVDTVDVTYIDDAVIGGDGEGCPTEDRIDRTYPVASGARLSRLTYLDVDGEPTAVIPLAGGVRVRLEDPDENRRFEVAETATVLFFPDDERRGTPTADTPQRRLRLTEVDPASGIFEGGLAIPGQAAPGDPVPWRLGGWYSVRYEDPDDPDDRLVVSAPLVAAPLVVTLTVRPPQASVGDLVALDVEVYNPNPVPTGSATVMLQPFPGVLPLDEGLWIAGQRRDPPDARVWSLPIGALAARGRAHVRIVGQVRPDAAGRQEAWGEVWVEGVRLSERAEANLRVLEEPVFSRSTVFVTVYADTDGDGRRDWDEPGVPGVRIVAGEGLSAWTDPLGRAHFAALAPGADAFRIDPRSLPNGWEVVGDGGRYLELRPGMLHMLAFGVRPTGERAVVHAERIPWRVLRIEPLERAVAVTGSLREHRVVVGGRLLRMLEPRLAVIGRRADVLYLEELRREGSLRLRLDVRGGKPRRWFLELLGPDGERLQRWGGRDEPPEEVRLPARALARLLGPGKRHRWRFAVVGELGEAVVERPFRVLPRRPRERLGMAAYYGFGESGLDPKTIAALAEVAELLRRYPDATVLIEGFTDDRGPREVNVALSRRRAEKAKEYLVLIEGIDPERIQVRGVGPERFVAPNDTEEHRALNRRVEVSVFGVPAAEERRPEPRIAAGDAEVRLERRRRFVLRGRVDGDRLRLRLVYPSGATFAAAISIPTVRVRWPAGAYLFAPDYSATLTLEAPPGTTIVVEGGPPLRLATGSTEVTLPLAERAALRIDFHPPSAPSVTWIGRVYLEEQLRPPPQLARYDPTRFLELAVPREGARLQPGWRRFEGRTYPGTRVWVTGRPVTVDSQGRFAYEVAVTGPTFALAVSAVHPVGLTAHWRRSWPVAERELLAVGVLDLRGRWSRRSDLREASPWSVEAEGRLYVEGWLPGEVLLKARLRQDPRPLGELLAELLAYEGPAEDLIDPARLYPVYGDTATSVEELPGAGALALYVRWRGQWLEVGTLTLADRDGLLDSGAERTYGARLHLDTRPAVGTALATELDLAGTQPRTLLAEDRFWATGGLFYRLRYTDLVEGSVVAWVEEEDPVTGLRTKVAELELDRDYVVDYAGGRLWLRRPLAQIGPPPALVRDETVPGGRRQLVVSYRYRPWDRPWSYGHAERIRQRLGDLGELGVGYREGVVDGVRTRRGRAWAVVRPVTGAELQLEFGRRWGATESFAESADGGLRFDERTRVEAPPANAAAVRLSWRGDRWSLELHGRGAEAGYADHRYAATVTDFQLGVGVAWRPISTVTAALRGDERRLGERRAREARFAFAAPVGPVTLTTELRYQVATARRADAAMRLSYPWRHWRFGIEHQERVYTSDGELFRRTGGSLGYALGGSWEAGLELYRSTILQGGALSFGRAGTAGEVRLSYGLEHRFAAADYTGIVGLLGRQRVGRIQLTGGQELRHGRERGEATVAGLGVEVGRGVHVGLDGERGRFRDPSGLVERWALRPRLEGRWGRHRLGVLAAWDRTEGVRAVEGRSLEAGWRTWFRRDLEQLLRFRYAKRWSLADGSLATRYQEWAWGLAYRPHHGKLALLNMARWVRELLAPEADPGRTEVTALILSLDGTLRLDPRWEVGWKLGGKRSGLAFTGWRSDPSHTLLAVVRGAWIFWPPFDLWAEYRLWYLVEARYREHGPLLEVGVRPARWVRFAVGYNFTRFASELEAHDRFDQEGFSVRVQGIF